MTNVREILDFLNGVGPVLVAVAAVLGGLFTVAKNAKRFRSLFASDQTPLIVELRLLSETRQEMITTLTAQNALKDAEIRDLTEKRDFARMSADQCERRLAELRETLFLEHRP